MSKTALIIIDMQNDLAHPDGRAFIPDAAHRAPAINNRYTLWPAVMTVGLVILGVGIPDFGTAVVLGVTAAVVFFVAAMCQPPSRP